MYREEAEYCVRGFLRELNLFLDEGITEETVAIFKYCDFAVKSWSESKIVLAVDRHLVVLLLKDSVLEIGA